MQKVIDISLMVWHGCDMHRYYKPIFDDLKKRKKALKLGNLTLARLAGVSRSTIVYGFNGSRVMGWNVIEAIDRALRDLENVRGDK